MESTHLFERLKDYRVDFAYSKELYFAAAQRLKKEFTSREKWGRSLNITAAALSIFTLTALQLFLSESLGKIAIYVASAFSFVALVITIWLFFYKNPEDFLTYHKRADAYLFLYKKVKNLEAQYQDGLLTGKNLADELERIHQLQEKACEISLPTTEDDYSIAQSNISKGRFERTGEETQNT